jgi:hypothetical protein
VDDQITISKTLSIRHCGLKEGWLRDQIENDASIRGLGDLQVGFHGYHGWEAARFLSVSSAKSVVEFLSLHRLRLHVKP